MKKKGSLNLSIEIIIVVVIAFVVLGLGLSFVRTQFGSMTQTTTGVQEQIRQQILEDLRTGDKKLSFPATTLNIERGSAQDIAIGVKNTGNNPLTFNINLEVVKRQGTGTTRLEEQVKFFYSPGPFTLKQTEAEAYNIKITAAGDKDTYLINLKITDAAAAADAAPYAEKTFFVNII